MPISGKEMLKKFEAAGWIAIRQKGSHLTVGKDGQRQTIPMHKELSIGVEKSLLKTLGETEKKK